MVVYTCDGCGQRLSRKALRYTVCIDVQAAYDKLEIGLDDLVRDHRAELVALIEALKETPAAEIEQTVYKRLRLDLCPACQKVFIADPLHFHPERGGPESPVDIDAFLRSLGYGDRQEEEGPQ